MDKSKLVEMLNQDLGRELSAIHRYLWQSAVATGVHGRELRELFRAEIADELGHAEFLSDKIVALGGTPTLEVPDFGQETDLKAMVESDISYEIEDISQYTERAQQAEQFGDVGLKVRLEEMVSDETDHKEQLERILTGWESV